MKTVSAGTVFCDANIRLMALSSSGSSTSAGRVVMATYIQHEPAHITLYGELIKHSETVYEVCKYTSLSNILRTNADV
jgi:hypothetical protein